jgi:4-amino-4-deoxy-L-arabinose transferase-like glycosyltransferase
MLNMQGKNTNQLYLIILVVATIPRLLFIILAPEAVGDGKLYLNVAENIFTGCGVSISGIFTPGYDGCTPHFGGNHGPGYPAFIAGVWWISGHSDFAVRIAQGMIYITSLVYLVGAIHRYTFSSKLALFSGLILAISPLQVAWPRFIFTETLALAGTLWLFAELIKSLHESKLRVIPIAFALILSTFIRIDGVLLLVPVAITGFIIHRPLDAILRGFVIAIIISVPWGGWILRNMDVGLKNIFTPPSINYNSSYQGLIRWGKTWTINQYQYASLLWPVAMKDYNSIVIGADVYRSKEEKEKVIVLLKELSDYTGKKFPKHIDDQFEALAKQAIDKAPITYYLSNPIRRMWALWFNIYDSFAWPVGLNDKITAQERVDIVNGGLWVKFIILKKYPVQTLGKAFLTGWRIILYLGFIISIWIIYREKYSHYKDLLILTFSFVAARSIFSGFMNYVEIRYTLMQMPIIEFMVVIVIAEFIIKKRPPNLQSHDRPTL